ncbi:hypothetical protein CDL26_16095 [Mediterraneibacter gnavus]|uniref:Uncharacterized protein n=1 Tax=Mediterraneibacter gnavus TaxID=33038 RepID=A0A2N5P021_MEDGN|nr:4'-phosphopantetheinyl transferase superfamily protein [Mediterraneibacter gnavus]PLT68481.1 hypothetical protein CDL26_16095 [Mediterraneibacter gnavus]
MEIRGVLLLLNSQDIKQDVKLLSDGRQKRLLTIQDEAYKKQIIMSEFLLRHMLKKFYGVIWEDVKILERRYGKPYIYGKNEYLKFNISHTDNAVICVISDDEIGVDIEKVEPVEYEKICRIFTIEEQTKIISSDSLTMFYEVFTKKEAYTKMLGLGLNMPFNAFNVLDNMDDILKTLTIGDYMISISSRKINQNKIFLDVIKEDEIKLYE